MDTLEQIMNVLKNNNNPIALECFQKIQTEEILFQPGFIKNKEHLVSLYQLRLQAAEDLKKEKFKIEELNNWKKALEDLNQIKCNELLLCSIDTEEKLYMIFVNPDTRELGAIFFLYQKKSLADHMKYNQEIKERGYTSSTLKYRKGILIEK